MRWASVLLVAWLAAVLSLAPAASHAGEASVPGGRLDSGEVLERNLYKTLTYEVLTNGFDAINYGLILGGNLAGAPVFIGVNAVLAATSYYAHETAWDLGFTDPEPFGGWSLLARTATYRVVSSAKTYGLALLFTGDPVVATSFAVAGAIGDVTVYLANDWAWHAYWPLTAGEQPPDVNSTWASAKVGTGG